MLTERMPRKVSALFFLLLIAAEFIEFDIGPASTVTGMILRGRPEKTSEGQWVTEFLLSYGNYSALEEAYSNRHFKQWVFFKEPGRIERTVFEGNFDSETPRYHYFSVPIVARYVRIHPTGWHKKIGIRAAIIGCPHNGECPKGFMRVNKYTPCVENLLYSQTAWMNSIPEVKKTRRDLNSQSDNQPLSQTDSTIFIGREQVRQLKRRINPSEAVRVLDGEVSRNGTLSSCLVMDNYKSGEPLWIADLGRKRHVAGVVVLKLSSTEQPSGLHSYLKNLDKLAVFIARKPNIKDVLMKPERRQCAEVYNANEMLTRRDRLLFQCKQPMLGRYVVLKASSRDNNIFTTVICEIEAFD